MAEILKFLNDPAYSALVAAVAAIGLSAMARRGVKVPLLYEVLNYLVGRAPAPFPPKAPDGTTPAPVPATTDPFSGLPGIPGHPIANALLAALTAKLGGKTLSSYDVADKDGAVVVTLKTQ